MFTTFNLETVESRHPGYTRIVDEVTESFIKEVKDEYGLICSGDGGSMPWDLEVIHVKFAGRQRATIEEARELMVILTEKLVKKVNECEKIKAYLREIPFTPIRAEISIYFMNSNGEEYFDGSVSHVFSCKNYIFYKKAIPNKDWLCGFESVDLLNEPYEEAVKIVKEAESQNKLSIKKKDLVVKKDHSIQKPTEMDLCVDEFVKTFSKNIKEEFGIAYLCSSGDFTNGIEELVIKFDAQRRANLDEAREIEVKITQKFLEAINNDEKLIKYLRIYPFELDRAKINICFNKLNNEGNDIAYAFQARNLFFFCKQKYMVEFQENTYDEFYKYAYEVVKDPSKKDVIPNKIENTVVTPTILVSAKAQKFVENQITTKFVKEIEKKLSISYVNDPSYDFVKFHKYNASIGLEFNANMVGTVETAKNLEAQIIKKLLKFLNEVKAAKGELGSYIFSTYESLKTYTFTPEMARIKINFTRSSNAGVDIFEAYSCNGMVKCYTKKSAKVGVNEGSIDANFSERVLKETIPIF